MKFKVKPIVKPKNGDTKTVIKFAWKPIRIGDHRVWLERYEVLYKYTIDPIYEGDKDILEDIDSLDHFLQWREMERRIL